MKLKVYSKFHGKEGLVNIKERYRTDSFEDALAMLDYEVYNGGSDALYARRKLAEIKRLVCGALDCKCPIFIERKGE